MRSRVLRGNPLSGNCGCRRTVDPADNVYERPIASTRMSGRSVLPEALLWISQWQWAWLCSGCSRAVRFIFSTRSHA